MAWHFWIAIAMLVLYGWPLWRVTTFPDLSKLEQGAWGTACVVLPGLGFLVFWIVCVLPRSARVERRIEGQING